MVAEFEKGGGLGPKAMAGQHHGRRAFHDDVIGRLFDLHFAEFELGPRCQANRANAIGKKGRYPQKLQLRVDDVEAMQPIVQNGTGVGAWARRSGAVTGRPGGGSAFESAIPFV